LTRITTGACRVRLWNYWVLALFFVKQRYTVFAPGHDRNVNESAFFDAVLANPLTIVITKTGGGA